MAVQKNFVVRNGIEVNNNLLVADSSTDHVGVGTSSPKYTLEVIGGIGVTYVDVLGISTVAQEFNVGTGGTVITSLNTGLTGFGTVSPAYIVDIRSPVSTGQTALYVQGDVRVTGDVYADDINLDQATFTNLEVTGVSTIATGIITTLSGANINYSGIGSFGSINTPTARITTGIVTTVDTTNLVVSGIASINTGVVTTAYINTGIVTNLSGTNLNYTGVTTVGDFSSTGSFDSYAPTSTFHGNVTVDGNITIGGTSGILNAVEIRIEDKDIVLGFTTTITPTDDTANHGGIAIASTEGTPLVSLAVAGINTLPDTYKQIMWVKRNTMGAGTTDAFLFNYGVGIGSTQVPTGVKLAVGSVQITDNTVNATNAVLTNLNASGVTTSNSYNIGATQVISSSRELQNIVSLDATTTATIETAIANAPNTSQDIVVTGIASINTGVFTSLYSPTGIITTLSGSNIDYSGIGTFGTISVDLGYVKTGVVTNLTTSGIGTITTAVVDTAYINTGVVTTISGTTLNYSGLSTIANFRITPIGSGATVGNSGIVTYYGDGSQLSNIISGVGIRSTGALIGTGFTTLNFIGAGNTFAVNGTTIDISISGGAGAGGTWTTYTAGIATSKSVGVHTSTIDEPNLTGVGNSFNGLYVANGMIIVDNQLNGDHYIGTSYNGLMAGPVTVNGILTVDGNYVVV